MTTKSFSTRIRIENEVRSERERGTILQKRAEAKVHYDKKVGQDLPEAQVGDYVYLKPSPHNKGKPWLYGVVTDKPTPRSYVVDTPQGRQVRRNRVQLRPAAPPAVSVPIYPGNQPNIKATCHTIPSAVTPSAQTSTPVAQHSPSSEQPTLSTSSVQHPGGVEQPPDIYITQSGRISKQPDRLSYVR